ncbi:MAG TPA: bifunctional diaminohydroxyphosphoribosylaminopyrimidine deaminase/5-amino-6-(5-phosphoribosylamino)uracil reductase RibD [Smithella sp.]|nr:bifunctional diaminohydroxyphosphoribosylaminopyrimidine deaminase/5-amino-6-(5-phosphoribosylamino)uracil reductase RibD [Smithella sp.]HQO15305.1 bifunctional diaminohydroxyphosphoribosylaminopyrimidine deaminase/5-amino-6-(5-phosphoribosylamino)uracil reductase RibD [Smithellaceae bacterium]
MNDEYYMKMALKLAGKGRGYVSPNPLVGAVIVKNGRIIGKGYHQRFGGNHAEINAIRNAGTAVKGSTLYVTLEPCCHEGKTPPCVNAIIENKIARVVIGIIDSNPLVCREGIGCLQTSGIKVTTGVLEEECRRLNETFFHFMETGMPFVTLKYAQSIDGRIATATGNSRWISSPASLKFAHRLRAEHDAILVGRGTVEQDNPELTVRLVRGRNPLRVVVDSQLNVSLKAKIFQNTLQAPTLIATVKKNNDPLFKKFSRYGAELLTVDADRKGKVDLKKLFMMLGERKISSVMIEGGAQIITAILKNNLADRMVTVIAPKIIGKGIEAVGDLNIKNLASAKKLLMRKILKSGDDIILDSQFI